MNPDPNPPSTKVPATSHGWAWLALAGAWLLLLVGCMALSVTVAKGGYGGVLLFAISCAGVAVGLLTIAVWRGTMATHILALPSIVPLLFILGDFLRRF